MIELPTTCPRDRKDCEPLAQVISDENKSFVCCGAVAEPHRTIPQDRFRLCWKNDHVDEMGDYDDADIKDTVSVLAQALSADEHMKRAKDD